MQKKSLYKKAPVAAEAVVVTPAKRIIAKTKPKKLTAKKAAKKGRLK